MFEYSGYGGGEEIRPEKVTVRTEDCVGDGFRLSEPIDPDSEEGRLAIEVFTKVYDSTLGTPLRRLVTP